MTLRLLKHIVAASCLCLLSFAAEQPNLVIIMADDLGFSDLGCYGGEIETPQLDQLAESGVRFTGFKNTCRCAPSRASLLTGRYSHSVAVGRMTANDFQDRRGYRGQLSPDAPTLAEILKAEGYGTGIVGKWHLTVTDKKSPQKPIFPLDRGFDFFHGTWWGAKDYFSPRFMMTNREHLAEGNYPKDYYLTHDLSKKAIQFVSEQIKEEQPFFLYLAHYAPHKPIQAPADRIEKCRERYKAGFQQLQAERFARQQQLGLLPEHTQVAAGMPAWKNLSKAQQQKWVNTMATYAAMIEIMDDGIGELFDLLKAKGEFDNTLILVLSDNGSTNEAKGGPTFSKLSNTPYRGQKAETWEGGVSSPLIVSWPERLKSHAGAIRHGRCHIIDILPTCLEATGVSFPASFRGKKPGAPHGASLLPAIHGGALPERPLFWEHGGRRAVVQDEWKLVADRHNQAGTLYHLKQDPTERKDLSKQFPDRVDALNTLWLKWAKEHDVTPTPSRKKQ